MVTLIVTCDDPGGGGGNNPTHGVITEACISLGWWCTLNFLG